MAGVYSVSQSSLHCAIIMDGNGRWARGRGMPRLAGHRVGADAVRRAVETAPRCGIGTLTLYAFSSDNWKRPAAEVSGLMDLLRHYVEKEAGECAAKGVRVSFIGRRDRLPGSLLDGVEAAERVTASAARLHLRIAVDYSSRDQMLAAARRCAAAGTWTRDCFSAHLGSPDVDLLIRTGGEQRVSDFLLWECAYAEFVFLPCLWPEFTGEHLEGAVALFRSRDRRFGRVPAA